MANNIISQVKGRGVPVRGSDIDTDRIIPARFLKCVTFDGLGEHAFEDDIAALAAKGDAHSFRKKEFAGASVLVSNLNFGCGSSREHAPQSLKRWGIAAIVAESFSEIFLGNCVALGLPCFTVDHTSVERLQTFIEKNPTEEILLDVESRKADFGGESMELQIGEAVRGQFLDGSWDAQSSLMANMEKVREKAKSLSYFSNYA